MTPAKLARLRSLIALSGSPFEEEARTAAYLACQMMREEHVDPTEVIGALPPAHGYQPAPPPRPVRREEPPRPEWTVPALPDPDVLEHNRMLQAELSMRTSQAIAAEMRLNAERRARAEEMLRQAALEEELQRRRQQLETIRRNARAMLPTRSTVPTGAGRREPW